MKKLLILSAFALCMAMPVSAQKYMVINSETILKSVDAYNAGVKEIETLGEQYQKNIDAAYEQIESQYSTYMSQKSSLSQSVQKQREETIMANEKKVVDYQESVFGNDGIIAKKQKEVLEPIRTKVFDTITKYAEANKYDLIFDVATNPIIVYYNPAVDKSEEIIKLLK